MSDKLTHCMCGCIYEEPECPRCNKITNKDRIEELEAKLAAMSQSKEHFKRAAEKQRQRCHKLRHRQRALMFALKNVKNCTSLDAAKFVACIAIGGWEDDEFVYKSRTTLAELTGGKDE